MTSVRTVRRVLFTLALLAGVALALPAPENFQATVADDAVQFSWDAVEGAVKYSVDVAATVTVEGVAEPAEVELSYGTSDRTDGGEMGDPDLTVSAETIIADIAAQLGVDPAAITAVDAVAKVKALNPGKGKGRQNHPFSNEDDFSL